MLDKTIIPATNPFTTEAPVSLQQRCLIDHLQAGNTINFLEAQEMGITHLVTRIEELKAHSITVYAKPIRIRNTRCYEYSLKPFINQ